jgi:bifunctional DNA-binding transcriptional regulator/antitoxin component of YhaV-PrlF toxin-antitoxin module
MGAKSMIVRQSKRSPSVRVTVPEEVVKELSLKAGDVLDWEVVSEGARRVMKVRRLE